MEREEIGLLVVTIFIIFFVGFWAISSKISGLEQRMSKDVMFLEGRTADIAGSLNGIVDRLNRATRELQTVE